MNRREKKESVRTRDRTERGERKKEIEMKKDLAIAGSQKLPSEDWKL